jgi:hypothetical protein
MIRCAGATGCRGKGSDELRGAATVSRDVYVVRMFDGPDDEMTASRSTEVDAHRQALRSLAFCSRVVVECPDGRRIEYVVTVTETKP